MVGSIGSNLAALKAFGTKMDVTANNIANVNSEEFKKSSAKLTEGANGDIQVDVERIDTPSPSISTVEGDQTAKKELSNVDLAEEMSEMIMTRHGYTANLKAVEAQNEMLGDTLDILG
jgi:flagellar hook protein FlgE